MMCFTNRKEGAEILLEYSGGRLDIARTREVDQHLERCAVCRRLVEAQRTVFSALDDWTAPAVSPDFDQKLYARIAEEKPSLWRRFWPATPIAWWKPALPVTLAGLALSAFFVMQSPHPQNQPGIGKADIEHVEQALDDLDLLAPAPSSSVM